MSRFLRIVAGFFFVGLLLTSCSQRSEEPSESITNGETEHSVPKVPSPKPVKQGLQIEGATIVESTAQGKAILFENVKGVRAVRRGPDGLSIHFLLSDKDSIQARCADTSLGGGSRDGAMIQPPTPPWDFPSIASYQKVDGCGQYGKAGGYLLNAQFFAFLKVDQDGYASVSVENLTTGATHVLQLSGKDAENVQRALEHQFMDGVRSNDHSTYFYPQEDAPAADGKLVLGIGPLLLAVDTRKERILGSEFLSTPPYQIVATSYWFQSAAQSPFVVVQSGWEGAYGYEALIDVSGGTFVIENLNDYPGNGWWGDYDTQFMEWDPSGNLMLHFYDEVDITEDVSPEDIAFFALHAMDEDMTATDRKNAEIEEKLRRSGQYKDVFCTLGPGMVSGCVGLVPTTSYRIERGGALRAL